MPKAPIALCAGLILAAFPLAAQIARPQLGYVIDSTGTLRPVIGIAAAASLGDAALGGATSFACSASLCLAKTDAALIAFAPSNAAGLTGFSQSTPAPPGPALIAIDDGFAGQGARAWIYFTASQQMALWQNGTLRAFDFATGGEMLSLRVTTDGFDYVVLRRTTRDRLRRIIDNAWIEHYAASDGRTTIVGPAAAGAIISDRFTAGPFATNAVMLIDGGVLLAEPDQLVLTRPDGEQTTFPLAGPQAFYSAGAGVVEIIAAEGLWILRTDPGHEQLALLPGMPQEETPGAVATRPDSATARARLAQ